MYKQKVMFLSDRFSQFELNVLGYLRTHPRAMVPGLLLVKNLLDDDLSKNDSTMQFTSFDDGSVEIALFVAVLTEKGSQFLTDWFDPSRDTLTYENG
jgi:hypothetical protein